MNHKKKKQPRCYTKSPSGEDMFRPIPGHISCTGVIGRCGLLPCAKKMVGLNHMACRSCPLKIIASIMIMCVCVCRSIRGTGGITTWTRLLYLQWGIKWSWKMLIAVYSLERAWVSLTLVWLHYACVCVSMLVCLFVWTDHLPEILNEWMQIFHEDQYREAVEGYCQTCQSAASGTQSDDDWTWSTLGTGLCFYRRWQAAYRRYKFNIDGDWLATSGSGLWINGTQKRQKFSSWFRCKV